MNYGVYTEIRRVRVVLLSLLLAICSIPAVAQPAAKVLAQIKPGQEWKEYETCTLASLENFSLAKIDTGVDCFGGWNGMQLVPKGFFYVLRDSVRWRMVDPAGRFYFNKAVVSVATGKSQTSLHTIDEHFGSEARWADVTTQMLRSNGFNGTGAWSSNEVLRLGAQGLPYVMMWNFMSSYGKKRGGIYQQPGHTGYPKDCIFVFDSAFQTHCDDYARKLLETKDDPLLIGHFSDNELPFPEDALKRYLQLDSTDQGYAEAVRWLRMRNRISVDTAALTKDDCDTFLSHVADRYFEITSRAIKKYDPNHLLLGARFYGKSLKIKALFSTAGKYIDVISINYYNTWTPDSELMRNWSDWSGRPFLVTEWYVKGEDSGLPNTSGAGWIVKTQADRGSFYQHFALNLLKSKGCVGWHWFKYIDNDPNVPAPDPSNSDSNKGIVNIRFEPYIPLLEKMKELNIRVYHLTNYYDNMESQKR